MNPYNNNYQQEELMYKKKLKINYLNKNDFILFDIYKN
jgi:hypothetical protein